MKNMNMTSDEYKRLTANKPKLREKPVKKRYQKCTGCTSDLTGVIVQSVFLKGGFCTASCMIDYQEKIKTPKKDRS